MFWGIFTCTQVFHTSNKFPNLTDYMAKRISLNIHIWPRYKQSCITNRRPPCSLRSGEHLELQHNIHTWKARKDIIQIRGLNTRSFQLPKKTVLIKALNITQNCHRHSSLTFESFDRSFDFEGHSGNFPSRVSAQNRSFFLLAPFRNV